MRAERKSRTVDNPNLSPSPNPNPNPLTLSLSLSVVWVVFLRWNPTLSLALGLALPRRAERKSRLRKTALSETDVMISSPSSMPHEQRFFSSLVFATVAHSAPSAWQCERESETEVRESAREDSRSPLPSLQRRKHIPRPSERGFFVDSLPWQCCLHSGVGPVRAVCSVGVQLPYPFGGD